MAAVSPGRGTETSRGIPKSQFLLAPWRSLKSVCEENLLVKDTRGRKVWDQVMLMSVLSCNLLSYGHIHVQVLWNSVIIFSIIFCIHGNDSHLGRVLIKLLFQQKLRHLICFFVTDRGGGLFEEATLLHAEDKCLDGRTINIQHVRIIGEYNNLKAKKPLLPLQVYTCGTSPCWQWHPPGNAENAV